MIDINKIVVVSVDKYEGWAEMLANGKFIDLEDTKNADTFKKLYGRYPHDCYTRLIARHLPKDMLVIFCVNGEVDYSFGELENETSNTHV